MDLKKLLNNDIGFNIDIQKYHREIDFLDVTLNLLNVISCP